MTTTTISDEQYEYACQSSQGERAELLKQDYRQCCAASTTRSSASRCSKPSGSNHYDEFFRRLRPPAQARRQYAAPDHHHERKKFPVYKRRSDWIQKYIFPGSELASVSEILHSLARATSLSLHHAEDIGTHYARTLAAWRERFNSALSEVRRLGFDDRFIRMWDYYLAYCEGAFLERHVGDAQILLVKNGAEATLFNEPWIFEPQSVMLEE